MVNILRDKVKCSCFIYMGFHQIYSLFLVHQKSICFFVILSKGVLIKLAKAKALNF